MNRNIQELEELCLEIRKDIAKYGYQSGRGHISSALSLVEILVAIYFGMNVCADKIKNGANDRDRIILSKGHAGLALYLTLEKAGIISKDILDGFATANGVLSTHPVYGSIPGVEMSAGSLGQGLGFACGVAWAEKLKNIGFITYVIVGDGELQEGSNWESMLFAAQNRLSKLNLIIDRNQLQITGRVNDIISLSPLKDKLEAFGFSVIEINGHDINAVINALSVAGVNKPKAIIANTVKGKGVSFMENDLKWHYKNPDEEQYKYALREVESEYDQ